VHRDYRDGDAMNVTILPPNATATELAVEATSARIGDVPVPNATLWDADTCPAAFLPWLANALSVDDWSPDWTDEIKREVIRQSINVHRRKGTIGALRTALRAADLGEVQVIERFGWHDYDGTYLYDGTIGHEARDSWAEYRIKVVNPLSAAQSARVQAVLKSTTPVRCHLVAVDYFAAAFTYNGAITHDGTFKYGEP
jgi:phage tail P2-like protein